MAPEFRHEKLRRMRYYLVAFFSGAAVLVIEIIGARILAPYVGTAYFVWVNVIGVILAALALGYWAGGVLADRTKALLPPIFFAAAFFTALIPVERTIIPTLGANLGIRLGSLAASLLLFAPVSMLLGMISPYLVKLATEDLGELGRSSGRIFAISTIGSIAATFATGFWLIPHFTITQIIWGVTATLCMLGIMLLPKKPSPKIIALGFLLLISLAAASFGTGSRNLLFEKNSQYYNIRVIERTSSDGGRVRTLLLDGSPQSATFTADAARSREETNLGRLAFPYIALSARLIDAVKPRPARVLAVGGGGYSIPEYIKRTYPESNVTVVEIDPEVTSAARRFFIKENTGPIETVSADGRVFLNRNDTRFDLIYTDAYGGAFAIPWHLATREALQKMLEALTDDGVLLINIASALEGEHGKLFVALWNVIYGVFPEAAIFSTNPFNPRSPQNVVVVAAKKPMPGLRGAFVPFDDYRYKKAVPLGGLGTITDDYAPTDVLMQSIVIATYPALKQYWE